MFDNIAVSLSCVIIGTDVQLAFFISSPFVSHLKLLYYQNIDRQLIKVQSIFFLHLIDIVFIALLCK